MEAMFEKKFAGWLVCRSAGYSINPHFPKQNKSRPGLTGELANRLTS